MNVKLDPQKISIAMAEAPEVATQTKLAGAMGCSPSTASYVLARIRDGHPVRTNVAASLAAALGVPVAQILKTQTEDKSCTTN